MYATRFILVLVLLGTDASIGFSQLLPRRRQPGQPLGWKAVEPVMQRWLVDFGGKLTTDILTKALTDIGSGSGYYLDLQISLQIYAQSQMDPELLKQVNSTTGGDTNQAAQKKLLQELAAKCCASVFFAETEKFAEKMKSEKFSTPVLKEMHIEYEGRVAPVLKSSSGEGNKPISREIVAGQFFMAGKDQQKDKGDRRTVTLYESVKPKNKYPFAAHCSFVFTVQNEGKESQKTLSFDLYLEELKPRDGTMSANPWKVADVQYK